VALAKVSAVPFRAGARPAGRIPFNNPSGDECTNSGLASHPRFAPQLTCDNAEAANEAHHGMMRDSIAQELIAKANQAILEAHWLRRQGRSLRLEASVRASSARPFLKFM